MKDGKDNMKDNMKENIKPEKRGALLAVKGLSAGVEDKEILSKVDLMIGRGESHVLMGPNGAGKSTLGHVLMGDPLYHVISGKIVFGGTDITAEPADKRAKAGMFLSFQDPLEVPGLSLESFLRSAVEQGNACGDGCAPDGLFVRRARSWRRILRRREEKGRDITASDAEA